MNLKNWILNHKILTTVIIGIIILIIFVVAWGMFSALRSVGGIRDVGMPPSMANSGFRANFNLGGSQNTVSSSPVNSSSEIEVKRGRMVIKSQDAEADFNKLSVEAKNYGGYIERSDKSISNVSITIDAVLRISPDQFMKVIERLKQEFNVRSYNIDNYRISAQREVDELEVIHKTLADYEKLRQEIEKMPIGDKKISLLMNLTNQELALKQKEKNYQRELSSKEKEGDLATLNITIEQRKAAKLWPEDIGNNFKDRLSTAFKTSITILDNIVGGSIELFFRVIELIVFAIIIIIPVVFTWRIVRIIYWRYRR